MELRLSGQTGGRIPGGEKRQQQDLWKKVPAEHGRWSDGEPGAELQRVPQVKLRRTVGLEAPELGVTKLIL